MEINQELRLQLAKCKQDFRDLTEKFLISQATAYSLANQLQKYKCEACKDIVESVLGEKLLFEVRRPAEKPAEKPMLDERLRTCDTLIRSQARELTQLRQTLQHGKDDSVLLKQHLKDLLTHNDQGSHQGQGFRERLSEGYRLAERIACKLSPEIYEDEDDEQAQEKLTPSVNLLDDEKKVEFQQSQDECVSVPSTLQEDSACNQPYSDGEFALDEENVASAMDGACGCFHAEEDEISTGLPENQNDHDDMKGPEVLAPRSNAIFSLEDVDVSYARDVTKNLADLEDEEDQDIISSSVEQLVVEENEVQPDSLDEGYLAASVGHHLAGSCHPYRSASFPTERREVCLALDVNGDTWENCYRGPVSFPGSEVPASQAQLQKSTHVTDCLQWQLDQHFDCGDSKAMLGLSSTIWDLTSTSDSGNHGPLFLELGASISMKNPPKLEDLLRSSSVGTTCCIVRKQEPQLGPHTGNTERIEGMEERKSTGLEDEKSQRKARTCDTLIRSQARELTQLRQTLQHGKDDSVLLKQHLKDLLTHNDQGSHQGQGFRERLSEGYRLAERIACKLSPEIYEDEDDEQAQEKLTPSMELQEVEKREVPEESKDECGLMPSVFQGSSDSHQPYSNDKFNDLEADLGQDGACGCSHAKEEEIPTNVSDNENYHKPMSGQELPFPSVNLQDDEKKVVFQQSQDECVSVPPTLQEGSACNQPYSDGKFAFDEENVASAMDEACGCSHAEEDEIPTGLPENQNDHDDMKGPEVVAPRFSRQLPQMRQNGVPRDSLDEYYLTYSVLPGLSDSFWPYRSNAIFSLEDVDVSYARDVTKNLADLEDEEDQDIISSSVEQLVVEENKVQPDSLDECYLAASVDHHLAGSCHPYRSASFPTERREVCLALDVNGDTWEDCHRGPVSFPGSEVPTSQAQLQKSTPVTDCLQRQLDQHFDCGDSKAVLGLSSTIWHITSNSDSGNQGPLFLELDASISMKNPPKLEGEGSTASTHEHPVRNKIKGSSVLRQKGIRRKLLFGEWSLACRFPGLQA
ncbi:hypothetical protein JEQ12_000748 [Ovis aries]|uniref:Olduvai domain-containing protein n=1 Tax=Ovis aries TaxID=9940 RepID=A0A836AP44_SHEEP|nr:hypothetical protein JEQ12_000748 [Ovis aries]